MAVTFYLPARQACGNRIAAADNVNESCKNEWIYGKEKTA